MDDEYDDGYDDGYDDYDDYDDDYNPGPDPGPAPAPVPVALTISISGSFGSDAFTPNPLQASVGDVIIWTNNHTMVHHIVLGDGTVIGDIAPGASSVAVPLTAPTATYQCMIHPTMVGSINGAEAPAEPPTSPPEEAPPSIPGPYDY